MYLRIGFAQLGDFDEGTFGSGRFPDADCARPRVSLHSAEEASYEKHHRSPPPMRGRGVPSNTTLTLSGGNVQIPNGSRQFTASFGVGRFAPPPVQGSPYSAEESQEHEQTLSDGTHITQTPMRRTLYRDSQGRTRVERPIMMGPNGQQSPIVIEITDPVSGFVYTLDTQNKIAHRMTLQPFPAANGVGGGAAAP
jgi:hypothetical protein